MRLLCFVLALGFHSNVYALVITAEEIDGDVVLASPYGATLDLSGLELQGQSTCARGGIQPRGPKGFTGGPTLILGNGGDCDSYIGQISGPENFGDGSQTWASSNLVRGPVIGIEFFQYWRLYIDGDYVSGAPLGANRSTYENKTFDTLGMRPGSYTWSWSTDSITLNVVPIPAAAWLFASGLGLIGCIRLRRSA